MTKQLLILGLNVGDEALYDMDFDIAQYQELWSLNDFYRPYPNINFNKIFQVHCNIDRDIKFIQRNHPERWNDWVAEYNKRDCKIILLKADDRIKNYEVLPLSELYETFNKNVFVNSFCYMLAYAMYLGFKKISLRGFSNDIAYGDSFQYCLLLIDKLIDSGIEIDAPIMYDWQMQSNDSDTPQHSFLPANYGLI